jgi:hypothetical protein
MTGLVYSPNNKRTAPEKVLSECKESSQGANVVPIQDAFKCSGRVCVTFEHLLSSGNCPSYRFLS